MTSGLLIAFLASTAGAATPLILAALGELVVERAGVLNLGLEGMMLVGAVVGFSVTLASGSMSLGLLCAMLAGMGMALVFGLLVLTLLKLFLHDLSAIGSIFRIGALIGVAVIAFVASFLYQQFFNRSKVP